MSTRATGNRPARDRLLDAASELFYERGVHTAGIDTIIERAAVAKATLYSAFGSKEELVRAYLEARHASRRATVLAEMALHDDPRRWLLGVMAEQATALGAADPAGLARQLTVLYDGALAQSRPGRDPAAATAAKAAAQVLIDAASPARRKPRARPARAA